MLTIFEIVLRLEKLADTLRKSVVFSVEEKIVADCVRLGVPRNSAQKIFSTMLRDMALCQVREMVEKLEGK